MIVKHRQFIILIIILFLTGCTRLTDNVDNTINDILGDQDTVVNTAGFGYMYYRPVGVMPVYSENNNLVLKIKNSEVYFYVDIVGYYYKNENYIKDNTYNYYYKLLNYNDKKGFIGINKSDNDYFIEISYGYARVEGYTTKEDFKEVLANMLIILNNVKYNDTMIKSLLSEDGFKDGEISYELKKPESAKSNFSQYLQEIVEDEDKDKLPDVE